MEFTADVFKLFQQEPGLLTAGDRNGFNAMTIGWGSLGTLWSKPAVTVYVKPVRYTHDFMEKSEYFTVSFYGDSQREALILLGSLSGRDGDKIARSKLTPVYLDKAVTFREARVTLLCKKMYRHDLVLDRIPEDAVGKYYRTEAPHTLYIGELLQIL